MIKLKSLLTEADLYQIAGAMIPQAGPASEKTFKHWEKTDPSVLEPWTKNDANREKELIKITNEYTKWLDSTISSLNTMYNSDMYKMHLSSLKSGGSSRSNYDYLKNFIDSLKGRKEFIKSNQKNK